jgi:hypothetical protein
MKRYALILLAAVLSMTTLAAEAARGGKKAAETNALLEFDDHLTDGIQSDLLGPYDANADFDSSPDQLTLSTGKKRALYLDFSDCAVALGLSCDGPFDGTLADSVSASMTVFLNANSVGSVGGWVEFNVSGKKWELWLRSLEVTPTYDTNDQIDGYVIEDTGEVPAMLVNVLPPRRRENPNVLHGYYFMRWRAVVRLR